MPLGENLRSAIGILGETLRILPAAGGAVEYLQRPDAEQVDDERINLEVDREPAWSVDAPSQSCWRKSARAVYTGATQGD